MVEIGLGVGAFTGIVLVLALLVLGARRLLVPHGDCRVRINGREPLTVSVGQRLLGVLGIAGIHLPSACGGAGTCGLCRVRVASGGGEALPQELALLGRAECKDGARLACQVPVNGDMAVEVDEIYLDVQTWACEVLEVRGLATLIREIVLALPPGQRLTCRPGSFIQVTCPPYRLDYADIDLDPETRDAWRRDGLLSLAAGTRQPVTRAYSMANGPGEDDRVRLNIRAAVPPPGRQKLPAGVVSSWLFTLKPGDTVEVSGPFGHFFVRDSGREAIFIGGGVGMAPLHAQVRDLLEVQRSSRRISYWYGARCASELYYADVFADLAARHDNFTWHPALSAPRPEDRWEGATGFIHQVVLDQYLGSHRAPEDCEYYLCGPPLMIKAVRAMLDGLGVDPADIFFDDFGV